MLNVVVHSELTSSVSAWSASLGQRSVSAVECFIVSCWAFLPSFMWQLSKFYTLHFTQHPVTIACWSASSHTRQFI